MQCRKLTFCLALSETDVEAVVGRWTAVARMIKAISEVTDGPSKSQGLVSACVFFFREWVCLRGLLCVQVVRMERWERRREGR